jgi:hypothetical protein
MSFGDPFGFGLFGEFIPKGRMWDQSKLCVNIGREDQKGGSMI